MVPDDLVGGRMGGHNVVNHVANFHSWMLHGPSVGRSGVGAVFGSFRQPGDAGLAFFGFFEINMAR